MGNVQRQLEQAIKHMETRLQKLDGDHKGSLADIRNPGGKSREIVERIEDFEAKLNKLTCDIRATEVRWEEQFEASEAANQAVREHLMCNGNPLDTKAPLGRSSDATETGLRLSIELENEVRELQNQMQEEMKSLAAHQHNISGMIEDFADDKADGMAAKVEADVAALTKAVTDELSLLKKQHTEFREHADGSNAIPDCMNACGKTIEFGAFELESQVKEMARLLDVEIENLREHQVSPSKEAVSSELEVQVEQLALEVTKDLDNLKSQVKTELGEATKQQKELREAKHSGEKKEKRSLPPVTVASSPRSNPSKEVSAVLNPLPSKSRMRGIDAVRAHREAAGAPDNSDDDDANTEG